jgi:hypothetical protein
VVEREGAQYCDVVVVFCESSGNEGEGASGPVRSSRKAMLNVILFR